VLFLDEETLQQLGFPIPWEEMAQRCVDHRRACSMLLNRTPERRAYNNRLGKTPERKQYLSRWRQSPEQKAKAKERMQRFRLRHKGHKGAA
jgi:hypothetical protein